MTVTELMTELQRLAQQGEGGRTVTVSHEGSDSATGFVCGVSLEANFQARIDFEPDWQREERHEGEETKSAACLQPKRTPELLPCPNCQATNSAIIRNHPDSLPEYVTIYCRECRIIRGGTTLAWAAFEWNRQRKEKPNERLRRPHAAPMVADLQREDEQQHQHESADAPERNQERHGVRVHRRPIGRQDESR